MATEVVEMSPPEATASLLSLSLPPLSNQPYVSELLSFTLDRLHKVPPLSNQPRRLIGDVKSSSLQIPNELKAHLVNRLRKIGKKKYS